MAFNPENKYFPFKAVPLHDRQWPSHVCRNAPTWCSVDLRDGNQALAQPMDAQRKALMFSQLLKRGFKEIEVGFPAASKTDFDFVRWLIETDKIPDDVVIQVLTPARESLINETFEALRGVRRAIVHLYNSTSPAQRRLVFGLDKTGVVDMATRSACQIVERAREQPGTDWQFQYSPESFSATELDFAVEICHAVNEVWQPATEHKTIINLPATVEMSTPNIFADQIEWFSSHMPNRESIRLSVHPHNDRGTAVAAAELAILAGAERVEGTLFGNGERTGNVDVVTLALNLYTQGVPPNLDLSNIDELVDVAQYCNRLPVSPRHPYAGEMVFTAFSGSHQDAIRKGLSARRSGEPWEVPYLPIDPADLGRSYEPVIRVNSQSGKGGIAYLLEKNHGIYMPRRLQMDFSRKVQRMSDKTGRELGSEELWQLFKAEYGNNDGMIRLLSFRQHSPDDCHGSVHLSATLSVSGCVKTFSAVGNDLLDAYVGVMEQVIGTQIRLLAHHAHDMTPAVNAHAVAYSEIEGIKGLKTAFGVGLHKDRVMASLDAITAAVNRAVEVEGFIPTSKLHHNMASQDTG